jgi:hypothetical protein
VDDFTIVEDTRTGKIVSALNLIHQTWTYDASLSGGAPNWWEPTPIPPPRADPKAI